MSFRTAFLASLLILPFLVCSYKIDQSCTRKGVDGLVRDAMTNAFSMADSALRRLNQDPYDPHTEELIKYLFLPKNGQDPKDRDEMGKVRRIFEEVNKNYRLETTGELGNKDAVRRDSCPVPKTTLDTMRTARQCSVLILPPTDNLLRLLSLRRPGQTRRVAPKTLLRYK